MAQLSTNGRGAALAVAIAQELRLELARRQINRKDIERRLTQRSGPGLSYSTIQRVFAGARDTSVEQLAAVCWALDIRASDVVARAEASLRGEGGPSADAG